jgi:sugar (pentulose or hexulose) kinase
LALLGIDIGTSFVKGAVLDVNERRFHHIKRVSFPGSLSGLHPLFCEYDPTQIVELVRQMISEFTRFEHNVEGLVICTQMASMVLVDDTGRHRSNCIGWRDQRATMQHPSGEGSYFDVYCKRISGKQRRSLGNEMPVGMPGTFLFWMAEQGDVEPGLTPLSLGDFVAQSLCENAAGVEPSTAMAYCLLNLETIDWHRDVIGQLGLDMFAWPPLISRGSVIGHVELNGSKLQCYAPIGDYQCSLAGALIRSDELSINISTGSQVSRITAALELGSYQSRPFFDGQFANTISHLPAGRSLNVLVDLLTELGRRSGAEVAEPWRWISQAVETEELSDLKVDLGFYPGPCGDVGNISNIRETNLSVGTVFLAAFGNMAGNYRTVASRIWPSESWVKVVLSGGLANKLPALYRAIELQFGRNVKLCQCPEEALQGLLILAMTFSGRYTSVTDAMNELRTKSETHAVGID